MTRLTNCKYVFTQKAKFFDGGPEMYDIETLDDTNLTDFKPADVDLDDIASLSFTSGSTGTPKIVGLSHSNVVNLYETVKFYRPVMKTGYIFYGFLPLYHVFGFVVNMMAPLSLNCSVLLQHEMNPKKFLADFKEYRPQIIPAVPRVWEIFYKKVMDGYKEKHMDWLLKFFMNTHTFWDSIGMKWLIRKLTKPIHEMFGGRVKVLISAGATLKPNIRRFYEGLGFAIGDCYGLTETTGPANFNFTFRKPDGKMFYASPLEGNELEIRNPDKNGVGDIWVRGTLVMPGYIGNDAANINSFDNDKWFKTGDVGVLDKHGRLTVKARKKQVIVLDSGKNVYPDELEDLYLQNDEILMAAVFERQIAGKMTAYGVFQVKPGISLEKLSQIIHASNQKVASYKWVTHFALTEDELPQTSTKKIKHFLVKKNLDDGLYPIRKE